MYSKKGLLMACERMYFTPKGISSTFHFVLRMAYRAECLMSSSVSGKVGMMSMLLGQNSIIVFDLV